MRGGRLGRQVGEKRGEEGRQGVQKTAGIKRDATTYKPPPPLGDMVEQG
jgi:hypothetical protein